MARKGPTAAIYKFSFVSEQSIVKGLNPTLTIIKAANIGRYFQFGPILNRMCEITIPQVLNLKRKVKGQCFRTFI